jgi:rfaE bifunctional protein kinase chain/domain
MKKKNKVLVIGDVLLDIYTYIEHERYSPEDEGVPVFDVVREDWALGGAANLAKNLVALGLDVDISSILSGKIAISLGVESIGIGKLSTFGGTLTKNRVVNTKTNKQECRIDDRKTFSEDEIQKYLKELSAPNRFRDLNDYDAVIFSDYNKGVISKEVVRLFIDHFSGHVFIDTKKPEEDYWRIPDSSMKINSLEFARLSQKGSPEALSRLFVTMGGLGCAFYKKGVQHIYERSKVVDENIADPIGAGDCFLAGFVKKWLDTQDDQESMRFANKVARLSVLKPGTSTVTIGELNEQQK